MVKKRQQKKRKQDGLETPSRKKQKTEDVDLGTSSSSTATESTTAENEQEAPVEDVEITPLDPNEELIFETVDNDGSLQTLQYLLQLKTLFSQELPRMPRAYIARLVFDRQHQAMVAFKQPRADLDPDIRAKYKKRVIGGITYRPVDTEKFIEIAFCAVTSREQRRGYGRVLMNNLKAYCQSKAWMRFLTYADNFAVTYFEKQGFTKSLSIDESRYIGYIKDYTEATLMECLIHPHIDYLRIPEMVEKQREAVFHRMKEVDSSHSIFSLTETKKQVLRKLLDQVRGSAHSWPFLKPVAIDEAPNYYDVVKEPMDLETVGKKLDTDKYTQIDEFVHDITLICNNCRYYNRKTSVYYKAAEDLEKQFKQLMTRIR
jgi:histone acetyltransferase